MGRMVVMPALMALVLVASAALQAEAQDYSGRVAGKKFKIINVTPFDGVPACPEANPNTATFTGGQTGTVKIVGQWSSASIGVCNGGSGYEVPPSATIKYEIYDNWIVFRVPGRVGSAVKLALQRNNVVASVGVGNPFYVSNLVPI